MAARIRPIDRDVGWLLANARAHAAEPQVRVASTFAAHLVPPRNRSQVSRWESGQTPVSLPHLEQYERALGMEPYRLLCAVRLLSELRDEPLPEIAPPRNDDWWDETVDLLERCTGRKRLSAAQWTRLSLNLAAEPDALVTPSDWERLLHRLITESSMQTGADYLLREQAAQILARHPRAARGVLATIDRVLGEPGSPDYMQATVMSAFLPALHRPAAVDLLLRHAEQPVDEQVRRAVIEGLHVWESRGFLPDGAVERVHRLLRETLDDAASASAHRPAAILLHALTRRGGLLEGLALPPSHRRMVRRILDDGRSLSDTEQAQLRTEIGERLLARFGPKTLRDPLVGRILDGATSLVRSDQRGPSMSMFMLIPQGVVLGEVYLSVLRHARQQEPQRPGHADIIDEAMTILSWVLPASGLSDLLDIARDPASSPHHARSAWHCLGNGLAEGMAPLVGPVDPALAHEVLTGVVGSARRHLGQAPPSEADDGTLARGHSYVLGMVGRVDLLRELRAEALAVQRPAWVAKVDGWLDLPREFLPVPRYTDTLPLVSRGSDRGAAAAPTPGPSRPAVDAGG